MSTHLDNLQVESLQKQLEVLAILEENFLEFSEELPPLTVPVQASPPPPLPLPPSIEAKHRQAKKRPRQVQRFLKPKKLQFE